MKRHALQTRLDAGQGRRGRPDPSFCRVEMWRGGFRFGISVTGPFGRRCLTSLAMLRFHIPLIKPGRRFSRTRLSDKAILHMLLHTFAHEQLLLRSLELV
jgi:hypothetical protein